jgi:hypothetical protein
MLDFIGEMGLKNWVSLGQVIKNVSEEQCQSMLDHEVENEKRESFVIRIHQKLSALRTTREREELIESIKPKPEED